MGRGDLRHERRSSAAVRAVVVLLLTASCLAACAKDDAIVGDFFVCDDGTRCEVFGNLGRRFDASGHWVDLEPITGGLFPPAPYCLDQHDQGIYRVEGRTLYQQEFASNGNLRHEQRYELVVRGDIIDFHSLDGWSDWSMKRVTRQDAQPCLNAPPPRPDATGASGRPTAPSGKATVPSIAATALDDTHTALDDTDTAADISKPAADISKPAADISNTAADISKPAARISKPAVFCGRRVTGRVFRDGAGPLNHAKI